MNWIRPEKRLAIYMRDGLACVYCGQGVDDGATLTLDHLRPYVSSGSNGTTNLVTACKPCNSARGRRSWKVFAGQVAAYLNHGVTADAVLSHIQTVRRRVIDVGAARTLITRRGGFSATLVGARR